MSGDPGVAGPSEIKIKRESEAHPYLDSLNEAQYKGQLASTGPSRGF